MEPFKDSCDHCGVKVNKEQWTFDLKQCVVCDKEACKMKQKVILKQTMDKAVKIALGELAKND